MASSSSSISSTKKIVLKCVEGEEFEVDEAVALKSQTIKHMIEDDCADNVIPVPNVTAPILSKVIEYCKRHVASSEEELKTFDEEFVKLDRATLFDLILAANYLDIKGLLNITCQEIANMIKEMPVEEIRAIFNITNDFTPAEEEQVRKDNEWAFQ